MLHTRIHLHTQHNATALSLQASFFMVTTLIIILKYVEVGKYVKVGNWLGLWTSDQ